MTERFGGDFDFGQEPASQEAIQELLSVARQQLVGVEAGEFGLLLRSLFPAGHQGKCSVNIRGYADGQSDPGSLQRILSISVRTGSPFASGEIRSYNILEIPDGLHIEKTTSMAQAPKARHELPSTGKKPTVADQAEAYLETSALIERLWDEREQQREARSAESALGLNFVSDEEVRGVLELITGPQADPWQRFTSS